jgi:Protein of unknown function (DUF2793)
MSRTAQLALPLVLPAQAQKHVTVNEALARLDAAAQLRVISFEETTPPATAVDGAGYVVPPGASGAWEHEAGRIAIWCNGGWIFLTPRAGWRAWDEATAASRTFDGVRWVANAVAISAGGAATTWRVLEFDHAISSGGTNSTVVTIPAMAQVLGVTGRVTAAIAGSSVTGWRIGVAGSTDRYGSGLGTGLNSYLLGMSGTPVTYYVPTPLLISAEGGSFSAGVVRLAVHLVEMVAPRAV